MHSNTSNETAEYDLKLFILRVSKLMINHAINCLKHYNNLKISILNFDYGHITKTLPSGYQLDIMSTKTKIIAFSRESQNFNLFQKLMKNIH